MGNFTAKLELPRFIPKEQILGKHVFDSEVVCIGHVEDWTYSSDGEIKMVVKIKNEDKNPSTTLIPFYYIDRVGQFILLKTKRDESIKNLQQQTESKVEKEGKKAIKKEDLKNNQLKYFDEIDQKKLNQLVKEKKGATALPKGEKMAKTDNKKTDN